MKKQKMLVILIIGLIVGIMCFETSVLGVDKTNIDNSSKKDSDSVMYIKSEVNFRSGQSTSSKSYGKIPGGTEVTVLEKNSNGWYEVEYNGKTGYVSKTYLKETKPEKTKQKEDNSLGLKSLTIENVALNPEFTKNTYEYTGELTKQVDSLSISAKANDEKADVEISGDEGIVDGENVITILVKGNNEIVTYQITVNKKVSEEVSASNEQKEVAINPLIATGIAVGLLAVLIIILVIRNHSKNVTRAREFSMPYEPQKKDKEIEQEDVNKKKYKEQYLNQFGKTDEEDEDVPKAMRKKRERIQTEYDKDSEKTNRRGKHF